MEGNALAPLLEKLSSKFGTSVELLWGVLLKQANINSLVDSVLCVFVLVVSLTSLYFLRKLYYTKNRENTSYSDNSYMEIIWASGVIILLSLLIICGFAYDATISFLNPEYWALKQIIK